MNIIGHLTQIKNLLDAEQLDFALIGGLAMGAYSVQRFTNDIDILIDGSDRLRAKQALLRHGFLLFAETAEVMQYSGPIDLDILCANRPISLSMLRDAKLYPTLGIKIVGVEQLIGLKIQAYANDPRRELKDKADIAALIEKNAKLDWHKIKEYADLFEQWAFLESLQALFQSPR